MRLNTTTKKRLVVKSYKPRIPKCRLTLLNIIWQPKQKIRARWLNRQGQTFITPATTIINQWLNNKNNKFITIGISTSSPNSTHLISNIAHKGRTCLVTAPGTAAWLHNNYKVYKIVFPSQHVCQIPHMWALAGRNLNPCYPQAKTAKTINWYESCRPHVSKNAKNPKWRTHKKKCRW